MKSLFLEIITHDYYGQWVSDNALSTALSVAIAGAQEKAQQPARMGNAALKDKRAHRARSMLGEGNIQWTQDSEAENRRQDPKRWIKDANSWINICRRGYGIQGYRQRSSREVIRGPGRDKLKGQGSVGPEEGEASLQVQKWTHRCQRHIGHQSLEILC